MKNSIRTVLNSPSDQRTKIKRGRNFPCIQYPSLLIGDIYVEKYGQIFLQRVLIKCMKYIRNTSLGSKCYRYQTPFCIYSLSWFMDLRSNLLKSPLG